MADDPRLLVILVDALAYPYINRKDSPFLYKMSEEGQAYPMIPQGLYSGIEPCLTGVSAAGHGHVSGYAISEETNISWPVRKILSTFECCPKNRIGKGIRLILYQSLYTLGAVKKSIHPQHLPGKMIPYLVPGSPKNTFPNFIEVMESSGNTCTWYTRDYPNEKQKRWGAKYFNWRYHDHLVEWIRESFKTDSKIILAELSVELDRAGHRYGPDLKYLGPILKKIDSEIESLWKSFCEVAGNPYLMVLSDHGMSKINKTLNIERILKSPVSSVDKNVDTIGPSPLLASDSSPGFPKMEFDKGWEYPAIDGDYPFAYGYILNSTFTQFWCRDPKCRAMILERLESGKNINILRGEKLAKAGLPEDSRWGDFFAAVPEGTLILPNHFQGKNKVKGMHGYIGAKSPESRALALLWGEKWSKGREVFKTQKHYDTDVIQMTSIAPVVLDLFGLSLPQKTLEFRRNL